MAGAAVRRRRSVNSRDPADYNFNIGSYPSAVTPGTMDVVINLELKSGLEFHQELGNAFAALAPLVLDDEVMEATFIARVDIETARAVLLTAGFTEIPTSP